MAIRRVPGEVGAVSQCIGRRDISSVGAITTEWRHSVTNRQNKSACRSRHSNRRQYPGGSNPCKPSLPEAQETLRDTICSIDSVLYHLIRHGGVGNAAKRLFHKSPIVAALVVLFQESKITQTGDRLASLVLPFPRKISASRSNPTISSGW